MADEATVGEGLAASGEEAAVTSAGPGAVGGSLL